jgi:hypothetical protein
MYFTIVLHTGVGALAAGMIVPEERREQIESRP